ncbi:MAG: stage V sporulation protein AC [Oscillospiraceae bacterium]|nr:stage V sporulation protein AC [Oscillospiraceae bacterium]
MEMSKAEYSQLVQSLAPKSKTPKNCLNAFWVGGSICLLGQLLMNGFQALGLDRELSGTAVSVCLIFFSAVLTGFAVYDDIAKFAGAGTLVPITGFANSVVAPAVEFRSEGIILGTCAKMFTIAGPVIVYGVSASVIYGLIYWITTLF